MLMILEHIYRLNGSSLGMLFSPVLPYGRAQLCYNLLHGSFWS